MILTEEQIQVRIESPMNLLNRLNSLGSAKKNIIPCMPPKITDVMKDVDEKLASQSNSAKHKALDIMNAAMDELKIRIPEIKAEKLAAVAGEMNKIVNAENNKNRDGVNMPQIIVYSPTFNQETNYETIHVSE